MKKDIGEIIRKLCEQKGAEIIEAEACPDHIHLLVSIPLYISIAQFMEFLKGKSSLMIFCVCVFENCEVLNIPIPPMPESILLNP